MPRSAVGNTSEMTPAPDSKQYENHGYSLAVQTGKNFTNRLSSRSTAGLNSSEYSQKHDVVCDSTYDRCNDEDNDADQIHALSAVDVAEAGPYQRL